MYESAERFSQGTETVELWECRKDWPEEQSHMHKNDTQRTTHESFYSPNSDLSLSLSLSLSLLPPVHSLSTLTGTEDPSDCQRWIHPHEDGCVGGAGGQGGAG